MPNTPHRVVTIPIFIAFFILALLIGTIGLLYNLALPGYLLFDDAPNLRGLEQVQDWRSLLIFISSGEAGPLGRPVSLATFGVQASAWPDDPAALLRVNFAIHLLATVAVFALAVGLSQLRSVASSPSLWIGLGVAALWGLNPFLATTHLMIIQRMSSLAGLLVFTGLAAFVWAHLLENTRTIQRWVLLLSGLGAATALAAYAKENGALLPLLALVILWLWIPRQQRLHDPVSRILIVLLVFLPSVLVLGYLAQRLPGVLEHGYGARRYFTPSERLMSQPIILLDYLRNLLLPRAPAVTPFMDRLPASSGWLNPPITLIAALFWPALLTVAVLLRRRAPYILFGLVFFLVGHLIESTFLNLELYFAHRNYIPAFGLYFGLVFAVSCVPQHYLRLATTGLMVYALLFAAVLFSVTSTWNHTHVNAEIWLNQNPHSQRAAQFLSTQYNNQGDFWTGRLVLDRAVDYNPNLPLLHIQRTGNCIDREDEFPQLMAEVIEILRTTPIFQSQAAQELLRQAERQNPQQLCPQRDHAALAVMADALLDNPLYANRDTPRSLLYLTKAFVGLETDNIPKAIDYFEHSFQARANFDVGVRGILLMTNAGDYDRAYTFWQATRDAVPESHLNRDLWLTQLDGLRAIIEQSERIDSETHD